MPDAPRWLSPEAAAAYVDLRVDLFLRRVRAGKMPQPSRVLGRENPRWDRASLDAAMGQGPASAANDILELANAAVQAMPNRAGRKAAAR